MSKVIIDPATIGLPSWRVVSSSDVSCFNNGRADGEKAIASWKPGMPIPRTSGLFGDAYKAGFRAGISGSAHD